MVSRHWLSCVQSDRVLRLRACLHTLSERWNSVIEYSYDWWFIARHCGCGVVLGIMQSCPRMSFRIRKGEETDRPVMGLFQDLQRLHKCISKRMWNHGLLLHLDWLLETSHKYYGNEAGPIHSIRLLCYVSLLAHLAIWSDKEFDLGWDLISWQ